MAKKKTSKKVVKTTKWKKAQQGLTMPKEQDFPNDVEGYHAAIDAYMAQMGQTNQLADKYTLNPIPADQRMQTSTSRFQEVMQQMPSVQTSMEQSGRNLATPSAQFRQPKENKFNWGKAALIGMTAFDAILPGDEIKKPVVRPLGSYNPHPYGTGSMALAQNGAKIKAYNPNLAAKDTAFQNWYLKNTLEGLDNISFSDSVPYDYYSFYKNGDYKNPSYNIKNHFPDTYKRPTHPTFSNESIYSTPENPGGSWKGEKFTPPKKLNFGGEIPISTTGYKANSKDRNKPKLRIPSNNITMENVPYPVLGVDSLGNQQLMTPGNNYQFPGEYVDEFPLAKKGKKIAKHSHKLPKGFEIDGKTITKKQHKFFSDLCDFEYGGTIEAKKGKKMKKPKMGQYISKSYENGGELQIEDNQFTPISDDTLKIGGNSHANGGTKLAYAGKGVEAEAGETFHIDQEGNGIIMGNMKNPLTGNKFKNDSKMLAKKEAKVDKLLDYSTELVNNSNPFDKWDALKFNSGEAMMMGAKMKKKELEQSRNHLTALQEAMLDLNMEGGPTTKGKLSASYGAKNGLRIDSTEKAQMGWMMYNKARKSKSSSSSTAQPSTNTSSVSGTQSPFDFYNTPSSQLDPEKFLQAIYSNEGGQTGIDPPIRGRASGKYALMPATQKDVFNKHYKSSMGWDEFKKKYDTDATFEHEVALSLAKDKIAQYPTAAEAIGSWYNPSSIKRKAWDEVPSPEYGNKISIRQYVDRAAKNYFAGTNKQNPNSIYGPAGQTPNTPTPTSGDYNSPKLEIPESLRKVMENFKTPQTSQKPASNYQYNWTPPEPSPEPYVGTDAEGLQFNQILPEIYAAATNKEEPVWMQQFNPQLFQDHEISLQDRRNQITSQGRASRQYLQDSAGEQAVLASQEYDALSQIGAEEFRINQGISNDITNKNIALLNESGLKNLQLADQQYVRQATGKSKTKKVDFDVLSSVSDKMLQNQLENRTLQVYENLYPHFRYDENYQQEKVGLSGADYLSPLPSATTTTPAINTATRQVFDKNNSLLRTTVNTPSALTTETNQEKLKALKLTNSLQGIFNKGKYKLPKEYNPGFNF